MALAGTSRMTAALSSAGCSHMFSWVCYQSRVTPFTHIPWWSPEEGVGLGHRGEEGAIFELQEEEGAGLEMKWDLILDSALWTDHCWSWAMSIHCTIVYFCMCLQSPVTEVCLKDSIREGWRRFSWEALVTTMFFSCSHQAEPISMSWFPLGGWTVGGRQQAPEHLGISASLCLTHSSAPNYRVSRESSSYPGRPAVPYAASDRKVVFCVSHTIWLDIYTC